MQRMSSATGLICQHTQRNLTIKSLATLRCIVAAVSALVLFYTYILDPDEYSKNLMHAFYICDVSESESPTGTASLKLKKVAGSSSGTSESAHVT